MDTIDKVLIGLSVCNCVLSVLAVHLVQRGLKKRQAMNAYKKALANAYEKSRIELSLTDILEGIAASKPEESGGHQQVIQVKGTRKSPNVKAEIA